MNASYYKVSFTANIGHGIDVVVSRDADGALEVAVDAMSATSLADAENTMQAAFTTLSAAWTKAKS